MSSTPQSPPKTPEIAMKMTVQNDNTKPENESRQNDSQNSSNERVTKSVSLAIREASDRSPVPSQPGSIKASQGPTAVEDLGEAETNISGVSEDRPATSQALEPFGWSDFEARYDKAMAKANEVEAALLKEFHDALQYFSAWTAAASQYDNDRAMKRRKTRETYIQQAERSLEEKRNHYIQVVEAFTKALDLLNGH